MDVGAKMTHCPSCGLALVLLQDPLKSMGFHAISDRTGEIRGCRSCDVTYCYGATRENQTERWLLTPFKCNEFSRANFDWDSAWKDNL